MHYIVQNYQNVSAQVSFQHRQPKRSVLLRRSLMLWSEEMTMQCSKNVSCCVITVMFLVSYLALLKLFGLNYSHLALSCSRTPDKSILCWYNRYYQLTRKVFLDPWMTWRSSPTYPPCGEQRFFSPSTPSALKAFCWAENEDCRVLFFSFNIPFWMESEMKNKKVRAIFSTYMLSLNCVVYWSKTRRFVSQLSSRLVCASNYSGVNVFEEMTKLWKILNSISRKRIDAGDLRLYDSWFLQEPNEFIQFRRVGQFNVGFPCSLCCVLWKFP